MSMLACHLTQRGVLRIGGDDRHAFLQGLISNDINLCVDGKMIYAALLTPQGKFLHDMFIADGGDYFLMDCEGGDRAEDLLKRLKTHKLRAKVSLDNVSDQFDIWGYWGENGNDPRLPALGNRAILKKGEKLQAQIADFDAYDQHRLSLGVPDGSRDMEVGKSTLLEGNFDLLNGISWTKGCYMGQELTARMHYRALIKKRMFPVRIDGPAPSAGTIILSGDDEVGEMRSSCGDSGLALLSVEKTKDGATFECSGGKLTVFIPDYLKSA